MRILCIAAICAVVGGCAARDREAGERLLNEYIGQPVSSVAVKNGPPVASFDMGANQRAFQWVTTGSYNTGGMAIPVGNMVAIQPGQTVTTSCRITFIANAAKPSQSLSDWTIASWNYNGNGC